MPYRLKHSESIPESIKRIAREEIKSATQHLRGKTPVRRDQAIHEARKSIKKVRALLRLVRPELGAAFADANAHLRDAGRKLSQVRDAGALITAFDELKKRCNKTLGRGGSLAPVRRALILRKKHLEEEIDVERVMKAVASELDQTLESSGRWPLETNGFEAIRPGLERSFRAGKKALAVAQKNGTRDEFHEWRKRVKDHWYHVRLLENLWSDVMRGYEHTLKDLEDALGEDLNLAGIRDLILAAPDSYGGSSVADRVVSAIDASRKELRDRALEFGSLVYAEKPRTLTKLMSGLWDAWRASPTADRPDSERKHVGPLTAGKSIEPIRDN